ncbi:MAG TPA: SDR family oxidoreductase [Candidatus Deferrimicrobiaceae bacterium]
MNRPSAGSAGSPRVLVLGATGMLGHVLFSRLSGRAEFAVSATVRDAAGLDRWFPPDLLGRIRGGVDAERFDTVARVLEETRPDVVVNCIGIIKQLPLAKDPVVSITVNALFPHRLARACAEAGARLIHVGTDCVFSGEKGNYRESDHPDATDLYGRTKWLGEVESPHCVTLRTSIIGHELSGRHGLIEWFLAQEGSVRGFARAVFSGFPTVELAGIVAERVIPNEGLSGLYHVSSEPISKFELLHLVREQYGRKIRVERDEAFACDRSLDSSRFREATGYQPPPWPAMVSRMHADFLRSPMYGSRGKMG